MIISDFIKGFDLILDQYDLNRSEKMIRVVLAAKGKQDQGVFVIIIEDDGSYEMFFPGDET